MISLRKWFSVVLAISLAVSCRGWGKSPARVRVQKTASAAVVSPRSKPQRDEPPGDDSLAGKASEVLEKATRYLVSKVATHGGYLWTYSEDLKQRAGEGKATETQIWVQPPGTPSVGFAFLRAYRVTGAELYLNAAKGAADSLAWGQLGSGGWDYRIDFDAAASKRWFFRRDVEKGEAQKRRRNTSTFDDNTSQSALRFLMAMDDATNRQASYRRAVQYGLQFMLKSQFDNGAWPQRYPPPAGYGGYYTFNDNAINDCIKVMLDAYRIYKKAPYLRSAMKGGDFIIASQLPSPQSGWAQQYDHDMKPAPARWFEPAACNGAATPRNIRTLIELFLETGAEKYLKPIPPALEWLEKSKLRDHVWARFYELGTNRPIYVTADHRVVYRPVNLRPGYSWFANYGGDEVAGLYKKVTSIGREKYLAEEARPLSPLERKRQLRSLEARVRRIIAAQDGQGRWLENGRIETSTFIRNINTICDYLEMLVQERADATQIPNVTVQEPL